MLVALWRILKLQISFFELAVTTNLLANKYNGRFSPYRCFQLRGRRYSIPHSFFKLLYIHRLLVITFAGNAKA